MSKVDRFLNECEEFDMLVTASNEIYLWVIDMQKDFIDEAFDDKTLFSEAELTNVIGTPPKTKSVVIPLGGPAYLVPAPIKKIEARSDWTTATEGTNKILGGRFGVDEGGKCVTDIQHYFDKLNSDAKLKNVIFSRDIHSNTAEDPSHCSFNITPGKGTIDGIGFPAHCVNGTNGCALHSDIETMVKAAGEKAIVVAKGCSHDTDSFGAFPYDCTKGKQYSELRQHNGCNTKCGDKNMANTGSWVLSEEDKFSNEIKLDHSDRTSIKDTLEKDTSFVTKTNVLHLICGLAGDYCVRDTAINLKFAYPDHTVAILADAVRYPALPVGAIVPVPSPDGINEFRPTLLNELHLNNHLDHVLGEKFFLTAPDTLLHTYSDKFLGGGGVVFAMDKLRQTNLIQNLTVAGVGTGNEREMPERVENQYWCLSRYMHLLGKQMTICDNSQDTKCYKNKTLKEAIIGEGEGDGRKTGKLKLEGGKKTRKHRKTSRKSKKSAKRKTARKVKRHRTHKK